MQSAAKGCSGVHGSQRGEVGGNFVTPAESLFYGFEGDEPAVPETGAVLEAAAGSEAGEAEEAAVFSLAEAGVLASAATAPLPASEAGALLLAA